MNHQASSISEHALALIDVNDVNDAAGDVAYTLDELDTGASADALNSLLHGYLLFACYVPITDNHRFKLLVDAALRIGMGGRVIGNYRLTCRLSSLNIRRRLTAEEKAQYGAGIQALVRVEYITSQDAVSQRPIATSQDGGLRIACVDAPDEPDVLQSEPDHDLEERESAVHGL